MAESTALLPLQGRTICVTRSAEQAAPLVSALAERGAHVLAIPTIAIVPPADDSAIREAVAQLSQYRWLILTSTNAVDRLFFYLRESGLTSLPESLMVAAVGAATATDLARRGVAVDVVPAEFRAEGLIEEFVKAGPAPGVKVLFPRAEVAREILPAALAGLGYEVTVAPVYRTVAAEIQPDALTALASIDGITFTSPTTARFFFAGCREGGMDPLAVLTGVGVFSIGPVTTAELVALGVEADRITEPAESTVGALTDSIVEAL